MAGVVALVNGMAFGGELGKKRTQGSGNGWGITGLLAKAEVKAEPFVVVGLRRLGHAGASQPVLERGLPLRVQVLHGSGSSPVVRHRVRRRVVIRVEGHAEVKRKRDVLCALQWRPRR